MSSKHGNLSITSENIFPVIKKLRSENPKANIVAIDYDPGASEVNQLNRIKLMISVAKANLADKVDEAKASRDAFVKSATPEPASENVGEVEYLTEKA